MRFIMGSQGQSKAKSIFLRGVLGICIASAFAMKRASLL